MTQAKHARDDPKANEGSAGGTWFYVDENCSANDDSLLAFAWCTDDTVGDNWAGTRELEDT